MPTKKPKPDLVKAADDFSRKYEDVFGDKDPQDIINELRGDGDVSGASMNSSGESAAREQWMEAAARDAYVEMWGATPITGEHAANWQRVFADIIARHYAAREREVQELVKAATKAGERIWEHHEIGHISRAFKQGAGSCELCSDGIFREIESALAPFAAKGETGSVAAQGEQHD